MPRQIGSPAGIERRDYFPGAADRLEEIANIRRHGLRVVAWQGDAEFLTGRHSLRRLGSELFRIEVQVLAPERNSRSNLVFSSPLNISMQGGVKRVSIHR